MMMDGQRSAGGGLCLTLLLSSWTQVLPWPESPTAHKSYRLQIGRRRHASCGQGRPCFCGTHHFTAGRSFLVPFNFREKRACGLRSLLLTGSLLKSPPPVSLVKAEEGRRARRDEANLPSAVKNERRGGGFLGLVYHPYQLFTAGRGSGCRGATRVRHSAGVHAQKNW